MTASRPGLAAIWMLGAMVSFSSMAIAGRVLAPALDTFEIMMYRSYIGIAVVVGVAWGTGRLGEIRARRMGLHFIRNISHFAGQNLWFFALPLIPLAQLFALEFTVPIWVALAAPLLLGEALTRVRVLSVLLGFGGVLIVTQPGAVTIGIGVIAAALAAIGFAGAAIFTKMLTRSENVTSILFWLTVLQALFGTIMVFRDGDGAWPTLALWPWVVLVGLAGLFAHLCLTMALRLAPASIVTPMDFMRLPVIAIIGALVYNEALDIWVLLGAVVIFAANYLNIWQDQRGRRPVG